MISETQVDQLNKAFKRLFALPLSRMTMRELQNIINQTITDKQDVSKALFDSLITGKLQDSLKKENQPALSSLIETYSSHVKMAQEVAEMGEFINSFSCDVMQQGNQVFFMSRMRRIDGTEFHFIAAPDMSIRLSHIFVKHIKEIKKTAGQQGFKLDEALKSELINLKKDIEEILS